MKQTAASLGAVLLLLVACGDDDQSKPSDNPPVDASAQGMSDAGGPGAPSIPAFDGGSKPVQVADAQTAADGSTAPVADAAADAASLGDGSTDFDATTPVDAATPIDAAAPVDAGPVDGGAAWILHQTCAPSSDPEPCYVCEDENCCDTYAAYFASPEAMAHRTCLTSCQGPVAGKSCEEQCHAQHPAGTAVFAARIACLSQFCGECLGAAPTPCGECAKQKCPEGLLEQTGTESGYLAQGCNNLCGADDTACTQACYAEYGVTSEQLTSFASCLTTNCPACGS